MHLPQRLLSLLAAAWLSWFTPVSAPAQVHQPTVFGERLCPDAQAYDSEYADARDFLEYQELMFVLWQQQHGCLDGERWNDYLDFRESARSTFPFMADAFGHWNTPLRDFGLYLGMFESGSYTLAPPTVGDLVEFEILVGWMEMDQNATPWFIPTGDESIRAFVPYLHTRTPDDPPPGRRFSYLAGQEAFQKTTHEVLIGLVTLLGEASIEHFEAFKAWLNAGDLVLTAEEISRAGGSKLWGIPAGSWADNLYRGTQGEMAYGNEASQWTVWGAGLSGAHEGAGGGLVIFVDTLSFGQLSNSEDYDLSVFDGADYDGARIASTVTRESLIIAASMGGGATILAGRTALTAGQTFNAVNAFIGASAYSYGMYGHMAEGNYHLAAIEGATMFLPWAGGPARSMNSVSRVTRQSTTPPTRKTNSPSNPATGPPNRATGATGSFGGVTGTTAAERGFLNSARATFGEGSVFTRALRHRGNIVIQRSDIPLSIQNLLRMQSGNSPFVKNAAGEWETLNLHHVGRQDGKLIEIFSSHNAYNKVTGGPLHMPGPGGPVRQSGLSQSYWQQRLEDFIRSGQVSDDLLRQLGRQSAN